MAEVTETQRSIAQIQAEIVFWAPQAQASRLRGDRAEADRLEQKLDHLYAELRAAKCMGHPNGQNRRMSNGRSLEHDIVLRRLLRDDGGA